GDGTTSGGGGGGGGSGPVDKSDASAVLKAASGAYGAAKSLRDAKHFEESIAAFQALASTLLPLTSNTAKGTVSKRGTTQIDRVARWYLQKIAHDFGGIYLSISLGLDACGRFSLAYLWSVESKTTAEAGGFPELPKLNGTNNNISKAKHKL